MAVNIYLIKDDWVGLQCPVSNNGFGSFKSFGFCQTDTSPRFSCIMYCYRHRQLTRKNLEVSEFSTLRKSTKRKSLVIRT